MGNSVYSNPFSQTAASTFKTPSNAGAVGSKTGFEHSIASLTAPHLDFSLRLAMQTTFDGTNPIKKKPKKTYEA